MKACRHRSPSGPLSACEGIERPCLALFGARPVLCWAARRTRRSVLYLETLPDDIADALNAAVSRISGTPMAKCMRRPQDLGELMVVSHAAVAAEAGSHVVVLIDETNGAQLAASEQRRLTGCDREVSGWDRSHLSTHPRSSKPPPEQPTFPTRGNARLYDRLRRLDDGLVTIGKTRLLSPQLWS